MDYLTILTTRSLILFPDAEQIITSPKPTLAHNRTYSSSSSCITTPTSSVLLLPPTPISMPLTSLLVADTNTAYFLVQHVLSSAGLVTPTNSFDDHNCDAGFRGVERHVSKDIIADAEVMVWKEMDKAIMFARELGASFGQSNGRGVTDEKALRELAGKYGLALKDERTHTHTHKHDDVHGDLVQGVAQITLA